MKRKFQVTSFMLFIVALAGCEINQGIEFHCKTSMPAIAKMTLGATASGGQLSTEAGNAIKPMVDAQSRQEAIKAMSKAGSDVAQSVALVWAGFNPIFAASIITGQVADVYKATAQNITYEIDYKDRTGNVESFSYTLGHTIDGDPTTVLNVTHTPKTAPAGK